MNTSQEPIFEVDEDEEDMRRRRFTIGSVRELSSKRNVIDTGVLTRLKPVLKPSNQRSAGNVNVSSAGRKKATFNPTLTLISETDDYCKPMVRTASLGNSNQYEEGQIDLAEIAKLVRRRLSVIREQQDSAPSSSNPSDSSAIDQTEETDNNNSQNESQKTPGSDDTKETSQPPSSWSDDLLLTKTKDRLTTDDDSITISISQRPNSRRQPPIFVGFRPGRPI